MHQKEIRETCYKCGHHDTKAVEGSPFSTDWCMLAKEACSTITSCDPTCRIPKKTKWDLEKGRRKDKRHRIKKEALDHVDPHERKAITAGLKWLWQDEGGKHVRRAKKPK